MFRIDATNILTALSFVIIFIVNNGDVGNDMIIINATGFRLYANPTVMLIK